MFTGSYIGSSEMSGESGICQGELESTRSDGGSSIIGWLVTDIRGRRTPVEADPCAHVRVVGRPGRR